MPVVLPTMQATSVVGNWEKETVAQALAAEVVADMAADWELDRSASERASCYRDCGGGPRGYFCEGSERTVRCVWWAR